MGSIEVRNPLLSKKLKRTETRLLNRTGFVGDSIF